MLSSMPRRLNSTRSSPSKHSHQHMLGKEAVLSELVRELDTISGDRFHYNNSPTANRGHKNRANTN